MQAECSESFLLGKSPDGFQQVSMPLLRLHTPHGDKVDQVAIQRRNIFGLRLIDPRDIDCVANEGNAVGRDSIKFSEAVADSLGNGYGNRRAVGSPELPTLNRWKSLDLIVKIAARVRHLHREPGGGAAPDVTGETRHVQGDGNHAVGGDLIKELLQVMGLLAFDSSREIEAGRRGDVFERPDCHVGGAFFAEHPPPRDHIQKKLESGSVQMPKPRERLTLGPAAIERAKHEQQSFSPDRGSVSRWILLAHGFGIPRSSRLGSPGVSGLRPNIAREQVKAMGESGGDHFIAGNKAARVGPGIQGFPADWKEFAKKLVEFLL